MTTNLPRVSKKNTEHALRTLALAKLLKDQIYRAEKQAKAYLAKTMKEKDRTSAFDDQGNDVATISMAKARQKPGTGQWAITDPIALQVWCDKHGEHTGGKPSMVFPEWFAAPAELARLVAKYDGEIPDGLVEVPAEFGEPSISVRQTPTQADALSRAIAPTPAAALIESLAVEEA